MEQFDAAIVGGGLGGLTLAIQLRKQGRRVVLFEKEAYPFHKVCGEYIAMESYSFLESCGVKLNEMQLPRINELQLSAPNGNSVFHSLNPGGFGISRYTLDQTLVTIAKELGVKVMSATKVDELSFKDDAFTIHTSAGIYQADFAFGAYGKRSNLDVKYKRAFTQNKEQGANNYVGVKYHIRLSQAENLIALHNFEQGYCGISKVDDNRYCLCYLTTAANLKKSDNKVSLMEERILHRNPHLKRIWKEACFLYESPLTISQIRFEPKTQIEQHQLMLGDAAGLITPLCGNGMSMAMHAAKIIATLIPDDTKNRESFEKQYLKEWQNTFALRLKAGRAFQSLFGSSTVTNGVVGTLKTFPFLLNPLIRLTHGKPF